MKSISYSHQLLVLGKRLLFLLAFFTLTRVIFLLVNFSEFGTESIFQLIKSLFFGVRFDMSVVYYCNILFILFSLLPFKFTRSKSFQIFLKILFVAVNMLLLGLNLIDAGYFSVIKRRSGWDMLNMLFNNPETKNLLGSYIVGYWHLVLMWLAIIFIIIRCYPRLKYSKIPAISNAFTRTFVFILLNILILGGGFGVARGIEGKPLRLISANDYVTPRYTPLLINTPFSILNTMGHKTLNDIEYMNYSEVEDLYSPLHIYKQKDAFKDMNVFYIILESFGSEYIFGQKTEDKNFTPFFDSLMSVGLFCSNTVANAYNSRDALPAIIAGVPSHRGIDYMGSRYSTNNLRSLPAILKEKGYNTSFFHGGHNGTMSFDKFAKVAEMDTYYGYDEYINDMGEDGDDGGWGIFDEKFLQFMASRVDMFKEPFFTAVFTLSSHDPFPIPPKYKNKFPKGELPILQSIAYSDFALSRLFETIKDKSWFSNTLFVLVADHTSYSQLDEYSTLKTRFSIPILFYAPSDNQLKGDYKEICQQTDIMPTVLDYLNYDKKFVAYGNSVFRDDYRFAVNYLTNFSAIDSSYTLVFDGEKTNGVFNYKSDFWHKENLYIEQNEPYALGKYLKAYIQDYEYRMVYNNMGDTIPITKLHLLNKL